MTSNAQYPPFDPAVVDRLLESLSTDDAFRELFASDPVAALAKVGYAGSLSKPPPCLRTSTLAPKEEIAACRKLLHDHLLGSGPMPMTVIFNFEAGQIERSLSPS
jgi:putative modified peptide